jgi:hypothetical protein
MTPEQKAEAIRRYENRTDITSAPGEIAREMGLDPAAVKAMIAEYKHSKYASKRPRVRYTLTDEIRDGLRLVELDTPSGVVRWYTKRPEAEIKAEIKKIEKRAHEGQVFT